MWQLKSLLCLCNNAIYDRWSGNCIHQNYFVRVCIVWCERNRVGERSESGVEMPRVRVVSRNFMEMVAALPAAKLDMLYERHWTCQAVLRSVRVSLFDIV